MGNQGKVFLSIGMVMGLWSVFDWWGLAIGIAANIYIWWIMSR